ncbi:HAD-IB family hydrolase [Teredinibacter sp. KSP-S5-2]|uniref:HAD family hydrolase n=1 Tax=Teredinibacter sp. KSP-S5-2 TaxID=3034506 RepID=UPI0029346724|nr:HAD-IB family hydrolase [Teredinibacter sp. KSP-S5-2]WNO10707.1 HAD-IB family hydrolase [Teredinibacter sp. KSP-S5-2]
MSTKLRAAFFDVDGTLISIKSLISFARYLEGHVPESNKVCSLTLFNDQLIDKLRNDVARDDLNRHYFSLYKQFTIAQIRELAKNWFDEVESDDDFYIAETLQELIRLKDEGYRVVFVTGSFQPLVQEMVEKFSVDHVLCTTPEIVDDTYTGELIGQPCIGETKRTKMLRYAIEHDIDLENSWAFCDDDTDIPMLQTVGNGVRINAAA